MEEQTALVRADDFYRWQTLRSPFPTLGTYRPPFVLAVTKAIRPFVEGAQALFEMLGELLAEKIARDGGE